MSYKGDERVLTKQLYKKSVLILTIFLCAFWLQSTSTQASVNYSKLGIHPSPAKVVVNGKKVDFQGATPYIVQGRLLVPFRFVFQEMGASVSWDQNEQLVTAKMTTDAESIELKLPSYIWREWKKEVTQMPQDETVLTYTNNDELISYIHDYQYPAGTYIQKIIQTE